MICLAQERFGLVHGEVGTADVAMALGRALESFWESTSRLSLGPDSSRLSGLGIIAERDDLLKSLRSKKHEPDDDGSGTQNPPLRNGHVLDTVGDSLP